MVPHTGGAQVPSELSVLQWQRQAGVRDVLLSGDFHDEAPRGRNVQHAPVPRVLGQAVHHVLELQVRAEGKGLLFRCVLAFIVPKDCSGPSVHTIL